MERESRLIRISAPALTSELGKIQERERVCVSVCKRETWKRGIYKHFRILPDLGIGKIQEKRKTDKKSDS